MQKYEYYRIKNGKIHIYRDNENVVLWKKYLCGMDRIRKDVITDNIKLSEICKKCAKKANIYNSSNYLSDDLFEI